MPLPDRTPSPLVDPRVAAAVGGDLRAFEGLYRDHVGRVHALALRMCGRGAFAEEMTQEVFVKAWRKLHLFDGRSRFSTWLHRLAVNTVVDGMRHEAHEPEATENVAELPDNVRYLRQGRIDLERAIAGLPTKARMVFVLHDVEGYKHEEIAEMMGISGGTARGQLHRARGLLREVLR
ncbi:MAG: RNA polymerase sigma factor [Myxococcales bacterium]|nr:RNA polymerase sigma factor [Myxococcales bacterium]MCB9672477.1 RNA polymerase sigma factor [Alphaproteobacteria bacterium]MCB9691728.1 RNA polymerase sigma factor [Alphaproteobacteria bacterium]